MIETTVPTHPSSTLRWRLFIGLCPIVGALILLGLIPLFLADNSQLARLEAELDKLDPGWRLDEIEANRAEIPDHLNSALLINHIARAMPASWPLESFEKNFSDLPLNHRLSDDRLQLLQKDLTGLQPQLLQARELQRLERGRFRIKYAFNPYSTLLPDHQNPRRIHQLLHYDALEQANRGDISSALRSAQAGINTGRSLYDDPHLVGQLIRAAVVRGALNIIESSLALGEGTDADLATLQRLIALEEQQSPLLIGFRAERATAHLFYLRLQRGQISMQDIIKDWSLSISTYDSFLLHTGLMDRTILRSTLKQLELRNRQVDAARLPLHQQHDAYTKLAAEEKATIPDNLLNRVIGPIFNSAGEGLVLYQGLLRIARTMLAVERYRLQHGKWPTRLEEIPETLLAGPVPLDYQDGKPLRYRLLPDGVVIYSLGPDGKDDGGNLDPTKRGKIAGTDVGFRLWNVDQRAKPALPPAAPGAAP